MIEISMTSPEGVTLETAGKYCADNINISLSFLKKWDISIASAGTDDFTMVTDPWFAENYGADNLCLLLLANNEATISSSTFTMTFARMKGFGPYASETANQLRYDLNPVTARSNTIYGESDPGYGLFGILSDGRVIYGGGAKNLSAGEYTLMAWLE